DLVDIRTMSSLLGELGLEVERRGGDILCRTRDESASVSASLAVKTEPATKTLAHTGKLGNPSRLPYPYGQAGRAGGLRRRQVEASYELVRQMRASFCVLGPLVARRRKARVSLPGGCVIGLRPIDLHLKGLKALGAKITVEHGYVLAEADRLKGAAIYLGGAFGSTVTGTANVMMAAVLARGVTTIENAACEPEVNDLADCLNAMGARISGAGTPRLVIEGVESLGGCEYEVIPDRVEAGTFILASVLTRGDIALRNVRLDHLHAVVDKL
ncbi:unnamed protein product, partial [marine sediment metagenome]